MAKESSIWKLWLRRNLLTKDIENDFTAEVSTAGSTLRNTDIAARIVTARSELRVETIQSILAMRDDIVRDALVQGTAVQDGCVHISPKVSGSWIGASRAFDPEAHKIGLSISPTAEMRAALETVGVEVLGEKDAGAYIGLITDVNTGKTDGMITPDEDVVITGDKIKIAPEGEAGLGVFFVDADGAEHPVSHKLSENLPKKLVARVPALAAGVYTLKIVTRYSHGSHPLNEPRSIVYEFPVTVEPPSPTT
jgi:hypothetical protein